MPMAPAFRETKRGPTQANTAIIITRVPESCSQNDVEYLLLCEGNLASAVVPATRPPELAALEKPLRHHNDIVRKNGRAQ